MLPILATKHSALVLFDRIANKKPPGPMLWSPLSEIPSIGRSPTYVLTLFAFIWLNFGVIYAPNFGCFLAFRFLTGFVGSPALATGAGSMTDTWDRGVRDYMITIWGTFTVAAPILGPLIGGFAGAANGWQWTIWPLVWSAAFVFVLLFFCLPETYGPNILERRAARVRRITGGNHQTQAAIDIRDVSKKVCERFRPFKLDWTLADKCRISCTNRWSGLSSSVLESRSSSS